MKQNLRTTMLLCMIAMLSLSAFAQSGKPFSVTGTLLDSLTNESEPYATIRVLKKIKSKRPVAVGISDINGKFNLDFNKKGDFILLISSVGRKTILRKFEVSASSPKVDFGKIYISDNSEVLEGVEIVAKKPLIKMDVDKVQYNVKDDPDSKTNTVTQMLRKVPLVTVDAEDNIKVNGSASFKVFVNGRPNKMMSNNPKEILRSMPADNIKHIEVISNPGVKYDAEGVGGILNIVTNQDSKIEGYTATINGGFNSNFGSSAGVYATVKKGKLTFSLNSMLAGGSLPNSISSITREQWNETKRSSLFSENKGKTSRLFNYENLEASYEIDSLRLLTLGFGFSKHRNKVNSNGFTEMKNNLLGDDYAYSQISSNKSNGNSFNANIDYQRSFKKHKGELLTFSYQFSSSPSDADGYSNFDYEGIPAWVGQLNLYDRKTDGSNNTVEHTFQTDYVRPFAKYHQFEVGAKYIIRTNSSTSNNYTKLTPDGDYTLDERNTTDFKHLNNILAGYLGYNLTYKKLGFKAGVRYEHTKQDVEYLKGRGQDFDISYDNLVPSTSLSYQLGMTSNIGLNYAMRISRPSIFYLNPYVNDLDPLNVSFGNPNLDAEKSHSLGLTYSNFSGKLNYNIGVTYDFNNNAIEKLYYLGDGSGELNEKGSLYNTYGNIGKRKNVRFNSFFMWNVTTSTRFMISGGATYVDIRSNAQKLSNSGWQGNAYASIQQNLPWKINASIGAFINTPSINLQGKSQAFHMYNLSLNRSFLKDRLNVAVTCSNIFTKYLNFKSETLGPNFMNTMNTKMPFRSFGIRISYRLGGLKAQVKKVRRSIQNTDLKAEEQSKSSGASQETK